MAQKKSDVIPTTDFQKTNYLKTNLLKQIKKICLSDSIRYFLISPIAKLITYSFLAKLFLRKFSSFSEKNIKGR